LNEADLLHTRDLYDAEVRSFDNKLRSLFDLLERTGLMDNSVVVLTADHGENLGEHHYLTHGHPYEPALHIPLLFHFPKDLGAGIRISSLVEGTDIVPTLMDLAGVAVPDGLDGHSLLPLIQDPSGESGGGRQFLLSCGGFNNENKRTYSLFDGRYRLIKDIRWSEKPLLYDISVDPSEENDISDANPDNVELFSALIQAMSSGALPPSEVEYDTQTEEMLRSLGYIH
jgi:arylsulfatase A-like enzyme